MDENEDFEFQQSPLLLANYLTIKNAGRQFSTISPLVSAVIDIRDFFYPINVINFRTASPATLATSFTITGGRGVYRVRGMAGVSGNANAAGSLPELSLNGVNAVATLILLNIPTAGATFLQYMNLDFLFDLSAEAETAQTLTVNWTTAPTQASQGSAFAFLSVQRVL